MEKNQKLKKQTGQFFISLLLKIVIFAIIFLIVFMFVFGLFRVVGNSMFPMFKDGDLCFYYRLSDAYMDDVVVYEDPDGVQKLGRVVGLEGQTIDFPEEGGYTVNDSIPSETIPYETYASTKVEMEYPLKIPSGSYFIMNDFRMDSDDSREKGVVEKSAIKGKVIYLLRRRSF